MQNINSAKIEKFWYIHIVCWKLNVRWYACTTQSSTITYVPLLNIEMGDGRDSKESLSEPRMWIISQVLFVNKKKPKSKIFLKCIGLQSWEKFSSAFRNEWRKRVKKGLQQQKSQKLKLRMLCIWDSPNLLFSYASLYSLHNDESCATMVLPKGRRLVEKTL